MYKYSIKTLKAIAAQYASIYTGLMLDDDIVVMDMNSLAEYKADFDIALQSLSQKFKWTGDIENCSFKNFRYYDKYQRVVIADIFGVTLKDDIPKLHKYAYTKMCNYLNGVRDEN